MPFPTVLPLALTDLNVRGLVTVLLLFAMFGIAGLSVKLLQGREKKRNRGALFGADVGADQTASSEWWDDAVAQDGDVQRESWQAMYLPDGDVQAAPATPPPANTSQAPVYAQTRSVAPARPASAATPQAVPAPSQAAPSSAVKATPVAHVSPAAPALPHGKPVAPAPSAPDSLPTATPFSMAKPAAPERPPLPTDSDDAFDLDPAIDQEGEDWWQKSHGED